MLDHTERPWRLFSIAGAENLNLFAAADGTFVIRPTQAGLWAIIC